MLGCRCWWGAGGPGSIRGINRGARTVVKSLLYREGLLPTHVMYAVALWLCCPTGKGTVRSMQKLSMGQSLKQALPLLPTFLGRNLSHDPTQLQGTLGNVVLALGSRGKENAVW